MDVFTLSFSLSFEESSQGKSSSSWTSILGPCSDNPTYHWRGSNALWREFKKKEKRRCQFIRGDGRGRRLFQAACRSDMLRIPRADVPWRFVSTAVILRALGERRVNRQRGLVFIRAGADLIFWRCMFYSSESGELADRSRATRKWGGVLGCEFTPICEASPQTSVLVRVSQMTYCSQEPSNDILTGPYPNLTCPLVTCCHWLDTWLTRTT